MCVCARCFAIVHLYSVHDSPVLMFLDLSARHSFPNHQVPHSTVCGHCCPSTVAAFLGEAALSFPIKGDCDGDPCPTSSKSALSVGWMGNCCADRGLLTPLPNTSRGGAGSPHQQSDSGIQEHSARCLGVVSVRTAVCILFMGSLAGKMFPILILAPLPLTRAIYFKDKEVSAMGMIYGIRDNSLLVFVPELSFSACLPWRALSTLFVLKLPV